MSITTTTFLKNLFEGIPRSNCNIAKKKTSVNKTLNKMVYGLKVKWHYHQTERDRDRGNGRGYKTC